MILLWICLLSRVGFSLYWLHRLASRMRPLWAVHVHHQNHHNLSLGVRNSPFSSLTSIPFFFALLAMLGVPLQVLLAVSIIHWLAIFFNHTALTPKLGWLEKVLIRLRIIASIMSESKQYALPITGGTFCCRINFSVRIVPGRNTT